MRRYEVCKSWPLVVWDRGRGWLLASSGVEPLDDEWAVLLDSATVRVFSLWTVGGDRARVVNQGWGGFVAGVAQGILRSAAGDS